MMFEMIFVLLIKIKTRLFRCKSYFMVFGATENNNQIKNIFDLTKQTSVVLENDFYF
jgi:hypothetical protein